MSGQSCTVSPAKASTPYKHDEIILHNPHHHLGIKCLPILQLNQTNMTQTEIIACFYIIAAAVVIMAVACLIQNRFEDKRLRADREAADAKDEDERIQNIMSQHRKP